MKDKSMILEAKEALMELIESINTLSFDEYTRKISLLSNGTIGDHTRHIIELFQQLLQGYETGNVDYDKRKRNIEIQLNIDFAVESIASIIRLLEKDNKSLNLNTEWNNNEAIIETNYYRELMYNIEHCIHHQAIIKISFLLLGKNELSENFGVAKSTIKYRN
ncbi:hypothetical protein [Daejeonella sp.]|jgi:uncharacterized damage-inducible protein DinB|uniref:hypothetical protein n=1 Tax=Daejeonella sp. TaxID=2805397 RepID=UPI003783D3A4